MQVIGITGGVGAGKSHILNFLREEFSACVVEADAVGHQVMEPGSKGYQQVIDAFGRDILREDGTIDRGCLGAIVFADEKKRNVLNAIIHPAVKETIREQIDRERAQGTYELLVVEAALLIEDHYEELCQEFWYIYTEPQLRRERLKVSRGYSDEKIDSIFASQLSDEAFRTHCQEVIENNGTKEETYEQLRELIAKKGWNLNKGETKE